MDLYRPDAQLMSSQWQPQILMIDLRYIHFCWF